VRPRFRQSPEEFDPLRASTPANLRNGTPASDHARLHVTAVNGNPTLRLIPCEVQVDWVGAVTAGTAGIAAVLAGINLYISGRREFDKWTRETLIEIVTAFLDGSFNLSNACEAINVLAPQLHERARLRKHIIASHDTETEALTRLRILAPPPLVHAALVLFEVEYDLAAHCFLETIQSDAFNELRGVMNQSRARFIEAARLALGIRHITGTSSFDKGPGPSWTTLRGRLTEAEEAGELFPQGGGGRARAVSRRQPHVPRQ
jgi:hypothetical protein